MKEIIFEVLEDEGDGGYVSSALGGGIHTEGETLEELRVNECQRSGGLLFR